MINIRLSFHRNTLLVLLVCGLLAGGLLAARRSFATPTVVVTVNISTAMNSLNQMADAQAMLIGLVDSFEAESLQYQTRIKDMEARYETATAEDKLKLRNDIGLEMMRFDNFRRYQIEKTDVEKALTFQNLYRNIREAIKAMAESEGYDIVLLDDSEVGFSLNPNVRITREDQIKQQINARRIAYANPAVDITQDLIVRMNNAHDAN